MGEFPLSQTEGVLESIQMKVSIKQLNTVCDKVLNLSSWIFGDEHTWERIICQVQKKSLWTSFYPISALSHLWRLCGYFQLVASEVQC